MLEEAAFSGYLQVPLFIWGKLWAERSDSAKVLCPKIRSHAYAGKLPSAAAVLRAVNPPEWSKYIIRNMV